MRIHCQRMGDRWVRWTVLLVLAFSLAFVLPTSGVVAGETVIPAEESGEDYPLVSELLDRLQASLAGGELEEAGAYLERATVALWSVVPLAVQNLVHVHREPLYYGDIAPREDQVYRPGDILRLYMEALYYTHNERDGTYEMHLHIDVKLLHAGREIVFHDPDFVDYHIEGARPNLEFFVDMSFNLGPGIAPGEYTVALEVTDMLSRSVVEAETSFVYEE